MPGTSFQAIIPAIDQHDDQRGGNCGRHRRQRRVRDRPGARRDGNVSFSYTLCDSGNPAPAPCSTTATVTFNIAGPIIWFVNPAAATNGDGRLSSPFTTLAAADAVDAANHRISSMRAPRRPA